MSSKCKQPSSKESVSQNTIECLTTDGKTIDQLPSNDKPWAIIKYGPTGSGKGSKVVKDEIEALDVNISECVVFEIDTIVEAMPNYRAKTYAIKTFRNDDRVTRKNSKQFYKNLGEIYFNARKKADTNFDKAIYKALDTNKNIIFETTGTNFNGKNPLEWIISEINKRPKYKIVVIYPMVSIPELQKRVERRAENQAIKENHSTRLYRGIDPDEIPVQSTRSQLNLTHFILPEIYAKHIHKLIIVWNE